MLHLWVIALFLVGFAHDAAIGVGDGHAAPWWAWVVALGPMAVVALTTHGVLRIAARELDRTGSPRAIVTADRMLGVSRWSAVVLHAVNVLVLGWLDAVRSVTGDLILVDELVCVTPPLAVFVAGWWSFAPIERRFREALLFRTIESGAAVHPVPSRREYVVMQVRHQLLLALVPIALMIAWGDTAERVLGRLDPAVFGGAGGRSLVLAGVQVAGVAALFAFLPAVIRVVWDTRRLGEGPLRERLTGMCADAGVRVRELLVWRTHGTMINGAVLGLWGRLRYILLTDALLDGLPRRQVEAVMAHEIAHARHAHIPWLAGALLVSVGLTAAVLELAAGWVFARLHASGDAGSLGALQTGVELGLTVGAFAIGLAVFGAVSRRFEWQADAFAAKALSDEGPVPPPGVTGEAVEAMAGALESVAVLNHLSPDRRSWRHGSIRVRQRRLLSVVGVPLDRLPIDRTARWIKRATAVGLVMLAVLVVRDELGRAGEASAPTAGAAADTAGAGVLP